MWKLQNSKGSWKHGGWEKTSVHCASEIVAGHDSHRGEWGLCYFIRLHFPNCNFILICSQGFNQQIHNTKSIKLLFLILLVCQPNSQDVIKTTKATVRYRKRTSLKRNRPILRKHKRALEKARVVLSSSKWPVFWADVWAGENNQRHWLTTALVTITIPPKGRKTEGSNRKEANLATIFGSAQRKEFERKANILGCVWPTSKISCCRPSSINRWSEQYSLLVVVVVVYFVFFCFVYLFFCQSVQPLSVSFRETTQLVQLYGLVVNSQLLEGRDYIILTMNLLLCPFFFPFHSFSIYKQYFCLTISSFKLPRCVQ